MKNYYELLEINKEADSAEIKKAYFKLVRKYPPERFPEEFKELRKAYETLFDDKKRSEYDQTINFSKEVTDLLESAHKSSKAGKQKEAIQMLKDAVKEFPEIPIIKKNLAIEYAIEGKNGLAMKLWEELVKAEPANAEYVRELALSYDGRGWNKKAEALYEKAVELDSGNAELWNNYINFLAEYDRISEIPLLCQRAIKATEEKNAGSLTLYSCAVYHSKDVDDNLVKHWISQAKQVMLNRPARKKDEFYITIMLDGIMRTQRFHMLPLIQELVNLLPRIGNELKEQLNKAVIASDIETIDYKGFDELIHDMLVVAFGECNCDDCKREMLTMECAFIDDFNTYKPVINYLKKEYPHLYELHAVFFDEVLLSHNHQKLLAKRVKALSRLMPEEFEYNNYFIPQTVRRETPKVGRNDPCPCGSGKKYKKCCGAGI